MPTKIEPLHVEMSARFSEMNERFDFLYRENEKRGQEYLVITERLNRIDTNSVTLKKHAPVS